jgi:branched-subunit amino acid ABC-type transport system permease component
MAYGAFYTIGAYTTWYFTVRLVNLPYFLALIIGLLCAGMIGMLSYILIFQRLQRMEGTFLATLIASMGLSMVLSQGGLLVYGTVPRSIPTVFPGALDIWGIHISIDKLALIGLGVAVTFFLFWVYQKTTLGRIMRAVAFLPEAASLRGINANIIFMVTLGMATALAGFAGGILAPSYNIHPQMGYNILWTVMLMVMLGGMDSLPGAVVAGILIGQILSFGQYFIGGTVQIIVFVIMGIILYFKPEGLMGRGVEVSI